MITLNNAAVSILNAKLLTPIEFFSDERNITDMSEYLGRTDVTLVDLTADVKTTNCLPELVAVINGLKAEAVKFVEGVPVLVQSVVLKAAEQAGIKAAQARKHVDAAAEQAGVILEVKRGPSAPRSSTMNEINEGLTIAKGLLVTSDDGKFSINRTALQTALTEKGFKPYRIKAIFDELQVQNVELVQDARGAYGKRQSTLDDEMTAEALLRELIQDNKILREQAETMMSELDVSVATTRRVLMKLELEGVEVVKNRPGRVADQHRLNVTRGALQAAQAAGITTRAGRIAAVRRFWAANNVQSARDENGEYTEGTVYRIILEVQAEQAAQVKPVEQVDTPAQAEEQTV